MIYEAEAPNEALGRIRVGQYLKENVTLVLHAQAQRKLQ
jgi:hypothetical protein